MTINRENSSVSPKLFLLSAARASISNIYRKESKSKICPECGVNLSSKRDVYIHKGKRLKKDIESSDLGVYIMKEPVCKRIDELSTSEVSFLPISDDGYVLRPISRIFFDKEFEDTIESDGACPECGGDLGRSALRVAHGEFVIRAGSCVSEFGIYRTDLRFGWAPEMEPLILFGEAMAKLVEKEFTGASFDECRFRIKK